MSSSRSEEGAGVAPQYKGSWSTFLRSVGSFNGDLSSLTAPPFILGTISLSEFSAYWTEHPSIFVAPASEADPQKRALLVLRWFLTTLKQQYCSRSDKLGSEKKPLNPFLGELFLGKWQDEAGETSLVSEQVSHHPPVTAYCVTNEKHGVRLQGYNAQKASFSRTIHVKQIGHALLHLTPYNEDYLITLPAVHIEGLIYGNPFVELSKATYIVSSTGFTSKVEYSGKGWVSGKKNTFSATMFKTGNEKDTLYSAEGQWNEGFVIKEGNWKKHATVIENFSHAETKITPLTVAPVEEQDPLEANHAWAKVKEGILKGDMDLVGFEKSKIENSQRELRKKEAAENREWERRYFTKTLGPDPVFETLAKPIGERIEADKTGGIWRFDDNKRKIAEQRAREGIKDDFGALSTVPTQSTLQQAKSNAKA